MLSRPVVASCASGWRSARRAATWYAELSATDSDLTIVGLVLGLGGAMLAGRLLSSQLFRVGSADPVVVAVTTALMVLVAIAACLVPAWDAGRSNPIAALRNE